MNNLYIVDTLDDMIKINQNIRLGDIVYNVRSKKVLRVEPSLLMQKQNGMSLFEFYSPMIESLLRERITFEQVLRNIKQIKYLEILKYNFHNPFTDEQIETLKLIKEMIQN